MAFRSPEFVVFLVAVTSVFALARGNRAKKLWMLAASYVFCAWPNPPLLLVLVVVTLASYESGQRLAAESDPRRKRLWLVLGLAANLGLLGWFKYAGFFWENASALLRALDLPVAAGPLVVVLPIGISFYTLQAIGYLVDVYRRPDRVARSLGDFALYLAFFPRLTAGPIVRSAPFFRQLSEEPRLQLEPETVLLFAQGFAKKLLIADNISPFVNAIAEGDIGGWPSVIVWLATIAFTVQIYCDFSGYTDMAIALGRLFGYRLPPNFDFPFFARNPSDFWRRWHVSFSSWIRDYIYTALPGSPGSVVARCRNIVITMLLAGLWHGASWGFVAWGLAHGLMLAAHDAYGALRRRLDPLYRPATGWVATTLSVIAMQFCLVVTMVFFVMPSIPSAIAALRKLLVFDFLFQLSSMNLGEIQASRAMVLVIVFALLHVTAWRMGGVAPRLARAPIAVGAVVCVALGFALYCLWPLDQPPFIYQRF